MISTTLVSEAPLWQCEIHQFKHKSGCFDVCTTTDALKVKYVFVFNNFECTNSMRTFILGIRMQNGHESDNPICTSFLKL